MEEKVDVEETIEIRMKRGVIKLISFGNKFLKMQKLTSHVPANLWRHYCADIGALSVLKGIQEEINYKVSV